jgi:hypothetical protein
LTYRFRRVLCVPDWLRNVLACAGVCPYEIHDDDLQFEELKGEYDKLSQKEKDRCSFSTSSPPQACACVYLNGCCGRKMNVGRCQQGGI